MGYRHLAVNSLKPKNVERLTKQGLAEGLSAGTLKIRFAALGSFAMKINPGGRRNAAFFDVHSANPIAISAPVY